MNSGPRSSGHGRDLHWPSAPARGKTRRVLAAFKQIAGQRLDIAINAPMAGRFARQLRPMPDEGPQDG